MNELPPHIIAAKNIQALKFGDANNLMLMMQDLMYFDTVPDEYKAIIRDIFEVEEDKGE